MKPNYALPIAALLIGLLVGLSMVGISGMVIHDSGQQAYEEAPVCPTNYLPDYWGVVMVAGRAEPIYRCTPNPDGRQAAETVDPATWVYPPPSETVSPSASNGSLGK